MLLTPAHIEEFRKVGYLVVRGMIASEDCDTMAAVVQEHLDRTVPPLEYETEVGYPGAPASLDAPGGRTIRRLRGAYDRHECFRAWASDPRVVAAMKQLLGEDVCLSRAHHNSIMTKHPDFGTATGWHRDIRYWSFARPDLISVWLALGDENAANGGLHVIPGSHRLKLQPERMDELDFLRPDVRDNHRLFERGIALTLQKGDVLFFHSGVFHAAGKNVTGKTKASVVFAYRGISNTPVPGTRSAAAGDVALACAAD
ncbi:MAG TPA: phytanoyl-CoA dioxygenase family protein [Burkholderiaceae bacterium]|jgi:phytanoyl-CoA hydroxylase|nr:phytanoyl-CoA dioxygenase family protein [Burkholderiaceae bacterium]